MVIDIRTIPEGHSVVSRETDLGGLKNDLSGLCGKISASAAIDRTGSDLYVHLQFRCTYKLECSRCLEFFNFPVEGDLRIVAREQAGKHGVEIPEEAREPADCFYDSRDPVLDLTPSIYEEIMVAFPLKPLCSENCKGLEKYIDIAISGEREKKEIDPRWAALRKLKKQ
jgi:uncharacterized protein